MSLLEQDTIRKRRVNNTVLSELKKEFKPKDNKEYKVEAIIDSMVYSKEANNQIPSVYYLVLWKSYLEKKNT